MPRRAFVCLRSLGSAGPVTLNPGGGAKASAAITLAPAACATLVAPAFSRGTTFPLGTTFALGPSFGATFFLSVSAAEWPASAVASAGPGRARWSAACAAATATATAAARGPLSLQRYRSEAFRRVKPRNVGALKALNRTQLLPFCRLN